VQPRSFNRCAAHPPRTQQPQGGLNAAGRSSLSSNLPHRRLRRSRDRPWRDGVGCLQPHGSRALLSIPRQRGDHRVGGAGRTRRNGALAPRPVDPGLFTTVLPPTFELPLLSRIQALRLELPGPRHRVMACACRDLCVCLSARSAADSRSLPSRHGASRGRALQPAAGPGGTGLGGHARCGGSGCMVALSDRSDESAPVAAGAAGARSLADGRSAAEPRCRSGALARCPAVQGDGDHTARGGDAAGHLPRRAKKPRSARDRQR
jgi:hypothetical protein